METKSLPGKQRRQPLWRRRPFWLAVGAATVVAAGIAYYFFTQDFESRDLEGVQTGKVEIVTAPEEATVLIDGKERKDKTPTEFDTKIGRHTITLRLAGYDEANIPIEVVETNPAVIQHTFTKAGQITVDEPPEEFKTYTNDRYRYRLRHPSSWEVEAESAEAVNFHDEGRAQSALPGVTVALAHGEETASMSVLVQPNPGNLSPRDWYQARPEYSQEDQSQIKTRDLTVNRRPAFQYETPYGFVPYLITVITGNGNTYLLQQVQNSPERQTYDQVIQTFTLF